jgi:hypothetical protein
MSKDNAPPPLALRPECGCCCHERTWTNSAAYLAGFHRSASRRAPDGRPRALGLSSIARQATAQTPLGDCAGCEPCCCEGQTRSAWRSTHHSLSVNEPSTASSPTDASPATAAISHCSQSQSGIAGNAAYVTRFHGPPLHPSLTASIYNSALTLRFRLSLGVITGRPRPLYFAGAFCCGDGRTSAC